MPTSQAATPQPATLNRAAKRSVAAALRASPLRKSRYRSIRRHRRKLKQQGKFRRRPRAHEIAAHNLERANDMRRGPLYDFVTGATRRLRDGIRLMRADAVDNLHSALGQLLEYLQPNGAVLRQIGGGWTSMQQAEMGYLAFGPAVPGELNPGRRFHRMIAMLKYAGVIEVTQRWETTDGPRGRVYRGKAAFIRFTSSALDALGMADALRKLADDRSKARGAAKAAELAALTNAKACTPTASTTGAAGAAPAAPRAKKSAEEMAAWRAMMADAQAALGLE